MGKLILVRHGKSEYNVKNIFTGWTDVDLAPEGIEEAKKAGEIIKSNKIEFDICFSSYLKRAIRTEWIILETAGMMAVDTKHHWKLNERHYGTWQGRNKEEVEKEVGKDLFTRIRRGFETPPPKLSPEDTRNPKFDNAYKHVDPKDLPLGESLKDTAERVESYFYEAIAPQLAVGKTVLVTAHGNSLRSLVGFIEKLTTDEVINLEIKTGEPILFSFRNNLSLIEHYPLT